MTKLKCPFCQQELDKDLDGYYTCYTDNCGCWANGGNGASGSKSLWLTLIYTKKKLDMLQEFITKLYLNGNITDEQLHLLKQINKRKKNDNSKKKV